MLSFIQLISYLQSHGLYRRQDLSRTYYRGSGSVDINNWIDIGLYFTDGIKRKSGRKRPMPGDTFTHGRQQYHSVYYYALLYHSGRPLSVTSGYASLAAHLKRSFSPAHTAKLRFSTKTPRDPVWDSNELRHRAGLADPVAATQVPMIIGVVPPVLSSATLGIQDKPFSAKRQIFSALSGGIMDGSRL